MRGLKRLELAVAVALAGCAGAGQTVRPNGLSCAIGGTTGTINGAYVRGSDNAKVTIVEFSDFQCPFCGRVEKTLEQIRNQYGSDVRLVWRNNPLPFHPNAMPAAKAAMAAGAQGKFWEMHDLIYENQGALTPENLEKWAGPLGLDAARFRSDQTSQSLSDQIKADMDLARTVGANGTPTFYIDGRQVAGAQPFEKFKTVIDEELTKAAVLGSRGLSGEALYAAELESNMHPAPTAKDKPPRDESKERKQIAIGRSPVRGPRGAPITVIMFSDFQCPFCGRAIATLREIENAYDGRIKFVWKNEPLPFHPNAMPAAKAAMAAYNQGKFWEMYDLLFQNQRDLNDTSYEKLAQLLGLDMDRWETDRTAPETEAAIRADMDLAGEVGANGTPTFFINGRKITGAVPFDTFKSLIDEELHAGTNIAKHPEQADD